jgi:PmbA protein
MSLLSARREEARSLLAAARPGEELEFYFRLTDEWRREQVGGRLENLDAKASYGVAVRCLQAGRMGFAYRRDARPGALGAALAEARALRPQMEADAAKRFAAPGAAAALPAPLPAGVPDQIAEMLDRLERAALQADARVQRTQQAGYAQRRVAHALLNSLGADLAWNQEEASLSVAALAAADGESQLGEAYATARSWDGLSPEKVGREAGLKAARLLGAGVLPTGRRDVVFPPEVTAGILEAAFPAWSAEAWQRGRSFLAPHLGERLAPADMTLADDALLPGGLYSAPGDEEGSRAQRTELLRAGVLAGCLHNVETAARAQIQSTGNGLRPELTSPPGVGPTNFILQPGAESVERLLAAYPGAFYAAEVLGLHTLDPVTGDFSLGASGWLLTDGGGAGQAVRGITLTGNLLAWFNRLERLANDAATFGHFTAPTAAVRDLTLAGS